MCLAYPQYNSTMGTELKVRALQTGFQRLSDLHGHFKTFCPMSHQIKQLSLLNEREEGVEGICAQSPASSSILLGVDIISLPPPVCPQGQSLDHWGGGSWEEKLFMNSAR